MEQHKDATLLPLHPRRAQQIFCVSRHHVRMERSIAALESLTDATSIALATNSMLLVIAEQELLQWRIAFTPQVAETPLPKRIEHSQSRYLEGVYEAKRGGVFEMIVAASSPPSPVASQSQRVVLRLTRDGSTLEVLQAAATEGACDGSQDNLQCIASVALVEIQQIVVRSACVFSLLLSPSPSDATTILPSSPNQDSDSGDTSDDSDDAHLLRQHIVSFVAASAAELRQWLLTLTCGANAFQQQQKKKNRDASDLVWQAARLRIFELAHVVSLPEAIALVTDGMQQLMCNGARSLADASAECIAHQSPPLQLFLAVAST